MISLLIKELFRSKGLIIGLVLLFVVGILSIHIGKVFVDRQEQIIELTEKSQKEHIKRHVKYIEDDIGLLFYYIRFGFVNNSSCLAALSIGQKDIRQAAQLVNIRNLEEQKNSYEFLNPFFQLLGNLDFSFVLIFLFPLIIISLCFNLWSEERESGRWSLLAVQSQKPKNILLSKLMLRLSVLLLLFFILLVIAVLYVNIPLDESLFSFVGLAVLYILFWFSLSWWVISLGKSSRQNAIILVSFWISFTFILPATVNSAVTYLYPIPEAYDTTIDSRDGYHTKWDKKKEPTIEKFKKRYPQYEKYSHPADADFGWFWYYAMQHLGDDESITARQAMKEKLHKRNELTNTIGLFVPSIHTQLGMNALCRTDMTNYLKYMEALESYHEKLRLSFYPKIFEEDSINSINWSRYGLRYFTDERKINLLLFLPLVLINLILLSLTYFSFKRTINL